jgi:PRC-barrel domain
MSPVLIGYLRTRLNKGGRDMTAPIEDVSSLPGKDISDQAENKIGQVKDIYASDGYPMWVAVDLKQGLGDTRTAFIPPARIKDENGQLRVPYSKQRIGDAPEVDQSDGISTECDRRLRDYYGIDAGDQELRSDNKSYATLVPDDAGAAERVENPDELETPDADTRTDESRERIHDPGSSEMRRVSAEDVAHNTQAGQQTGEEGDDENRGAEDHEGGPSDRERFDDPEAEEDEEQDEDEDEGNADDDEDEEERDRGR